jgi:hypothetical protein
MKSSDTVSQATGTRRQVSLSAATVALSVPRTVPMHTRVRAQEGWAMRVINATVSRAKPGRQNDAVGMAVEAGKLLTRHGAENCRLLLAGTAGEATGTYVFISEFQSGEAWGIFSDELAKDHELELLVERLTREDSPLVIESQGLASEIPLDRQGVDGRGSIVEAYISKPLPGRFEAALELAGDVFDFIEGHGGKNAQLFTQTVAGSFTDTLIASWEFDSMRALGAVGDAYMSEAGGLAILQRMTSADCPITTLSSGIYSEVPI